MHCTKNLSTIYDGDGYEREEKINDNNGKGEKIKKKSELNKTISVKGY